MSCYRNGEVWIMSHLTVTYLIELTCVYIYMILSITLVVLLVYNPNWYDLVKIIYENYYFRLDHDEEGDIQLIFIYSIGLVIKEVLLILIYVLLSYMYTWLVLVDDKNAITSMNFYRWFVEASHLPKAVSTIYSIGTVDNFIRGYRSFTLMALLMKIPVFVLMRWAETQKSFFLNDINAYFFYKLCELYS